MSDNLMLYEKAGRIVTITINRPEIRNSISAFDMLDAFEAVFAKAAKDHEVSCIVLTGAGSAFSSGGDVKGFAETAAENQAFPNGTRHWYREGIQRIPLCLDKVEIPIIAAVNGPAIGAG
jgi:enoyl-CoA hydratase/carnithine racemase